MIEEKHENNSFKNMNGLKLFADDNPEKNVFTGKTTFFEREKDADYYYEELIDAYTTEVPKDPPGLMGGFGYQTSIRLGEQIRRASDKLKEMGRQDLLDKFEDFKIKLEEDKKAKAEKVFRDAIEQIVDISKINPEIIPYLINIEKRLQKIERTID